MITNPLTELIPAQYRRYVYGLAALAALVLSGWQASEGDWNAFVGGLLAALVPALAASNTSPEPKDEFIDGHATV
jgi:hypothetical protein